MFYSLLFCSGFFFFFPLNISLDIVAGEGCIRNMYSLNLDEVMVGIKVSAAGKMSS